MAEKLPFSPYPPQARAHTAPSVRRSRRRLLPYLLLAILALIYFSRTRQEAIPYEPTYEQTQGKPVQHAGEDVIQHQAEKVAPGYHGSHKGVYDSEEQHPETTQALVQSATPTAKDTDEKLVAMQTETAQEVVAEKTPAEKTPAKKAVAKGPAPSKSLADPAPLASNTTKVALDAHIMSKCPDARDCLRQLVVPAMEEISELVNFNLSFVQTLEPDGSVSCKHGPGECLGDTLILCAQNIYPNSTVRSLGFATCMISGYRDIPERAHVQNCAMEHGVDFDKLNECASDTDRGERLLQEAVRWSLAEGVKYSCTVRVAGQNWCVRDGAEWKDCEGGSKVEDLVTKVKKLAAATQDEETPVDDTETATYVGELQDTKDGSSAVAKSKPKSSTLDEDTPEDTVGEEDVGRSNSTTHMNSTSEVMNLAGLGDA